MSLYLYPAFYGLFVWWLSTGVIVYLNNLPPRTFRWSMAAGTVVAVISLYRLGASSALATPASAYAAFTYGVLVWGWHEMAFFMGFVTGPRRTACARGCSGLAHFRHGVEACLDHELAIIISAVAVVWVTRGGANQVGMWTFMVLWGMRQSSKLNVFLGVRNLNEEFLPKHLAFLKSFMRRRPMNALFPVSIVVGTWITTLLMQRAAAADVSVFQATALSFVITMMALGVIEHWFLVLPLPFAKIWGWWLRRCGRVEAAPYTAPHACRVEQVTHPAVA
jgi:putative photosynthetic complex assembly protein 2